MEWIKNSKEFLGKRISEQDSHIKGEVKVVLHFPNITTEKELKETIGVNTSNLGAKGDLIALNVKAVISKIRK